MLHPSIDELDQSTAFERLREGKLDELGELFARLRPRLKQMIESRMNPRILARIDASDIVQETYMRAVKGLDNYLELPKFHPVIWLRLIGKDILAETHRAQFRDKRSPDREIHPDASNNQSLIMQLAGSISSVHSKTTKVESAERIRELTEQLNITDREILELRHSDELSLKEIAEMMSISIEAAKKRYQRAIRRFRELFLENFGNEESFELP